MRPSLSSTRRAQPRQTGGWCFGVALLGVFLPAVLAGQSTAPPGVDSSAVSSEECCKNLQLPLGARLVGLGRAVVADTAPDATLSNPAGLVGLHRAEFLVHYRKLPSDQQILGLSFVSRPFSFGTFALTYVLVDGGSVDLANQSGDVTGISFSQFHSLTGTFATRLAPGISAGLSYRLYIENTPCSATTCETGGGTGATQLIDVGVQWHPRWAKGFGAGAALVNAGIPLQIVNYEQSDKPPLRARVGAAMEVLHLLQRDTTLKGTLFLQLESGGPDRLVPSVGAELIVGGVVAVRAGWRSPGGAPDTPSLDSGAALGVGLKLDRFDLSVSRVVSASTLESDSPFQITFGIGF